MQFLIQTPPMTDPQTPLDQALQRARDNNEEGNEFYDAFLNCDVFMPVQIGENRPPEGRAVAWDEKFFPLFLKYEEVRVVALFDQMERMNEWAKGKTLDYLHLRSHRLLQTLAGGTGAILNIGTPWVYYFPPEILEQLRTSMRGVRTT